MSVFLGLVRDYLISVNVLLVFVPLGFLAEALGWHPVAVSALNLVAIMPLSALISDASDMFDNRWGTLVGGLVNATFGNIVELTVGLLAVSRGEVELAQSTMLGSILSDILMVQGLCFIVAARGTGVLSVNAAVVDALSSLMLITAVALILPAVLYATFPESDDGIDIKPKILSFSRATAAVLLCIYIVFQYFQFKTHSHLFLDEDEDVDQEAYEDVPRTPTKRSDHEATDDDDDAASRASETVGEEVTMIDDDTPTADKVYVAAVILVVAGLIVMGCTYFFLRNLDGTIKTLGITKTFVGMFIIPLASNASEIHQVIAASHRKKINFAISVIIGSILQIALFVLPILVIVGWLMNRAMDLFFEMSQTWILLLAVMIVNQVLQDGQYTYLHGLMLLSIYIIIGAAYFLCPFP